MDSAFGVDHGEIDKGLISGAKSVIQGFRSVGQGFKSARKAGQLNKMPATPQPTTGLRAGMGGTPVRKPRI